MVSARVRGLASENICISPLEASWTNSSFMIWTYTVEKSQMHSENICIWTPPGTLQTNLSKQPNPVARSCHLRVNIELCLAMARSATPWYWNVDRSKRRQRWVARRSYRISDLIGAPLSSSTWGKIIWTAAHSDAPACTWKFSFLRLLTHIFLARYIHQQSFVWLHIMIYYLAVEKIPANISSWNYR